jgi:hypothetical protein
MYVNIGNIPLINKTKVVQKEFDVSSPYIKSEFKKKIKNNQQILNEYKVEVAKCEDIFKGLSQSENKNNEISIQHLPPIGEGNLRSLDYSKIKTVSNNAKSTYMSTNDFISSVESDMKNRPLIDSNDPAYQQYLNYNETKTEMKKIKQRLYFRRILCVCTIVILVLFLIYVIINKSSHGDKIIFEEDKKDIINTANDSSYNNSTNKNDENIFSE